MAVIGLHYPKAAVPYRNTLPGLMGYILHWYEPVLLTIKSSRLSLFQFFYRDFNPFHWYRPEWGQCLASGYRPGNPALLRVILFPHFQILQGMGCQEWFHCSTHILCPRSREEDRLKRHKDSLVYARDYLEWKPKTKEKKWCQDCFWDDVHKPGDNKVGRVSNRELEKISLRFQTWATR